MLATPTINSPGRQPGSAPASTAVNTNERTQDQWIRRRPKHASPGGRLELDDEGQWTWVRTRATDPPDLLPTTLRASSATGRRLRIARITLATPARRRESRTARDGD